MTGFHGSSEEEDIEYESIPNSSVGVNMLAGALAGITEHVATYPLDVLKVSCKGRDGRHFGQVFIKLLLYL